MWVSILSSRTTWSDLFVVCVLSQQKRNVPFSVAPCWNCPQRLFVCCILSLTPPAAPGSLALLYFPVNNRSIVFTQNHAGRALVDLLYVLWRMPLCDGLPWIISRGACSHIHPCVCYSANEMASRVGCKKKGCSYSPREFLMAWRFCELPYFLFNADPASVYIDIMIVPFKVECGNSDFVHS